MGVAEIILNAVIVILGIIFFVGVIGIGVWLYMRWKRFKQFRCVIWERDGFGQVTETYDDAGIFVDGKTKNKRFFMKRANVGLEPDNIPYIPTGKTKVVYLVRFGLKNFKFIKPTIKSEKVEFQVGEEDVNWAINSYDRAKKAFLQTLLGQLLPYMMLAFISIIILIMFIYLFKNLGVFADTAIALKDTATRLGEIAAYNMPNATVVIPT